MANLPAFSLLPCKKLVYWFKLLQPVDSKGQFLKPTPDFYGFSLVLIGLRQSPPTENRKRACWEHREKLLKNQLVDAKAGLAII